MFWLIPLFIQASATDSEVTSETTWGTENEVCTNSEFISWGTYIASVYPEIEILCVEAGFALLAWASQNPRDPTRYPTTDSLCACVNPWKIDEAMSGQLYCDIHQEPEPTGTLNATELLKTCQSIWGPAPAGTNLKTCTDAQLGDIFINLYALNMQKYFQCQSWQGEFYNWLNGVNGASEPSPDTTCDCWADFPQAVLDMFGSCALQGTGVYITAHMLYDGCNADPTFEPTDAPVEDNGLCDASGLGSVFSTFLSGQALDYCTIFGNAYGAYLQTGSFPSNDLVCPCALSIDISVVNIITCKITPEETVSSLRANCAQSWSYPTGLPTKKPSSFVPLPCNDADIGKFLNTASQLDSTFVSRCINMINELSAYSAALTAGVTAAFPDLTTICTCVDTNGGLFPQDLASELTCLLNAEGYTLSHAWLACYEFHRTESPTPDPSANPTTNPTEKPPPLCSQVPAELVGWASAFSQEVANTLLSNCQTLIGMVTVNNIDPVNNPWPDHDTVCSCIDISVVSIEKAADLAEICLFSYNPKVSAVDMRAQCAITNAPSAIPTPSPVDAPTLGPLEACDGSLVNAWVGFLVATHPSLQAQCIALLMGLNTYLTTSAAQDFPGPELICPCFDTSVMTRDTAIALNCEIEVFPLKINGPSLWDGCIPPTAFPSTSPTPSPVPAQAPACTINQIASWMRFSQGDGAHWEFCGTAATPLWRVTQGDPYPERGVICECINPQLSSVTEKKMTELICTFDDQGTTAMDLYTDCLTYTKAPTKSPTDHPSSMPTIPALCTPTEVAMWFGSWGVDLQDPTQIQSCNELIADFTPYLLSQTLDYPSDDGICGCIDTHTVSESMANLLTCGLSREGLTASYYWNLCWKSRAPTSSPSKTPSRKPTPSPFVDLCDVQDISTLIVSASSIFVAQPHLQQLCTELATQTQKAGIGQHLMTINDYCLCFDPDIIPREMIEALTCMMPLGLNPVSPSQIYDQCLVLTPFPSERPTHPPSRAPTRSPTSTPTSAPSLNYCSVDDFGWALSGDTATLTICLGAVTGLTSGTVLNTADLAGSSADLCLCLNRAPYVGIKSTPCYVNIEVPVEGLGSVPTVVTLEDLWWYCTAVSDSVASSNDYGKNWWDEAGDPCHNPRCGYGLLDAKGQCHCHLPSPYAPLGSNVVRVNVDQCNSNIMPLRMTNSVLVLDACWPIEKSALPALNLGSDSLYGFEYVKVSYDPLTSSYSWTGFADDACIFKAWEGETTEAGQCAAGFMGGTQMPTQYPTDTPTPRPTRYPSVHPTPAPSNLPSPTPTKVPTRAPTDCSWEGMRDALLDTAEAKKDAIPPEIYNRWTQDCATFDDYIQTDYKIDGDVSGMSNRTMMCGCIYAEHIFGAGYEDNGAFGNTFFDCSVDAYIDGPSMWATCSDYWETCDEAVLLQAAASYVFSSTDTSWSTACTILATEAGGEVAKTTGYLPLTTDQTCACLDTRPGRLPASFGSDVMDCWFTPTVHGSYYWNLCLDYYLGCDSGDIINFLLPKVLTYEAQSLSNGWEDATGTLQTGTIDYRWGTYCLRVSSQFQSVVGTGMDQDLPSLEDTCPCLNPDLIPRQEVVDALTCWLTDTTMLVDLYDLCARQTNWLSGNPQDVTPDVGRRRVNTFDDDTFDDAPLGHEFDELPANPDWEGEWRQLWGDYHQRRREAEVKVAEPLFEAKLPEEPIRRRPAIGEGTPVAQVCTLCLLSGGTFNLGYSNCYNSCYMTPQACVASGPSDPANCAFVTDPTAEYPAAACFALATSPATCNVIAPAEDLVKYELSSMEVLDATTYPDLLWPDHKEYDPPCQGCLAAGKLDAMTAQTTFDESTCDTACKCTPADCASQAPLCMRTCVLAGLVTDLTADADGDLLPDHLDKCPYDPLKNTPGDCGCNNADEDLNGNFISDCVETGSTCQPTREWSPYLAAVLCPGTAARAYGVKMCGDYDNPMWQRRLELALANSMYRNCDSQCVYDIESAGTAPQWGFRWISSDLCYTAMTAFYCLQNQAAEAAEAIAKKQFLCDLPQAPCKEVLTAADWTPELAAERCPVRNDEPMYTSDVPICNDWERDPWGHYAAAGTLYQDRLYSAMANHVYRSCNSRCVYDIESGGNLAFQFHTFFKCWKKQTWWNCFTVYVSEWNEAKTFIAGENYGVDSNQAYPPLCRQLENTPAPTDLGCVARVQEQEWTSDMADAVCPASRSGSTNKGADATLCPDHKDWDIMIWRLRTALANRMFKTCLDWCVYDLTTYASSAFIWNDHLLCYNHVTWYTCINTLYKDRIFMRDWSEAALCDSSTPEPTYQPTCRPEWYYSDDRLTQLCAPTGTGVTYKHVDTDVDGTLHDAVVCAREPCQADFPELIVSHPECTDCDGARITGVTGDCSAIFDAIQSECSGGCGGLTPALRWTSPVNLLRDQNGNKFLDGDFSFFRTCALSLGICNDCTDDAQYLPDFATCADALASEASVEAACNITAIASACSTSCDACDTETVPTGQELRHPANSAEYTADMEDLYKSFANRMFQDCTSWCVYSWNRIHLEPYGWKWEEDGKCWNPITGGVADGSDCIWDYGGGKYADSYITYKSSREVTCTRAPTTSPTGCYPTDYSWNQARSEELCEFLDQGTTNKGLTAKVCDNSANTQADFDKNIAQGMFPKCNSLCIYNMDRMAVGLAADPIYAPNGQWRWHGTDECWEYGSNGYQTCVGNVLDPVQDWLTVADHYLGFCGVSDVPWDITPAPTM